MFKRRDFIKSLGLTTAAYFTFGDDALGEIRKNKTAISFAGFYPIRIQGKVFAGGQGIADVVVSDGRVVVKTNKNGEYQLISGSDREFIFVSQPSGFEIKKLSNGSSSIFKQIEKIGKDLTLNFELVRSGSSDERHHFLLLSDTQIQNEYEANQLLTVAVPDVVQTIQSLNDPNAFGIGCGDLVFDKLELFKEYNQSIQEYGIPFFQVIGNHDMDFGVRSDAWTGTTFKGHFGPTYYSWNRGEIHYVVLDDVFYLGTGNRYIGHLPEEQLAWLEQDLSFVEKGRTVVISLHIPTYTGAVTRYPKNDTLGGTVSNRDYLYRMLEGYQVHILSGHTHFNDNMIQGNIYEHCHGTVCGAWWSGPICYDGTPSGYAIYEASGSELRWKYKGTGMETSEQFRVYPKGYQKEFPDHFSLNCWNYDPKWEISWYENGVKMGTPEKIMALDPWSVALHTGPTLPARRTWVEPQLTDHLFFFKPSSSENLVVEVKDRFGNVYTKQV